jgi:hypothetical protein
MSDARITLGIYGHVIGDSQRNAVDKVGELLRPESCAHTRSLQLARTLDIRDTRES